MVGASAKRAFCPGPLPPGVVRPQGKKDTPQVARGDDGGESPALTT